MAGMRVEGLIQPSIVRPLDCPTSKLPAVAGLTRTRPLPLLKLKAVPTSPLVKPMPFSSVPVLPPMMSVALPWPGHQATMPEGGASQEGGGVGFKTVRSAALLLVKPKRFVTITE